MVKWSRDSVFALLHDETDFHAYRLHLKESVCEDMAFFDEDPEPERYPCIARSYWDADADLLVHDYLYADDPIAVELTGGL